MTKKQKKELLRIIIATSMFFILFITEKVLENKGIELSIGKIDLFLPLYIAAYLVAGYDVLIACFRNIIHGKFVDEKFLMTVATIGAFIIKSYEEAVFVMVFYQVGELFQSIAVGRSRKNIANLMDICPETAVIIRDGVEEEVMPEEVSIGDIILVKPGEKIPLDGTVISGSSDVDMAALTGESVPFEKNEGDAVLSGSINLTSAIKIRVEKEYDDCTVSRILSLIEDSSLNKAKTEVALTKFARIYTPAVMAVAFLVGLIGSLVTKDPATWVYQALVCLVVSCPCAIVISVPMAYFGGIGGASSKGILVKGSNYLEALADAETFVFDKTGTLTSGNFTVTEVIPAEGMTKEEVLGYAAIAETHSLHPIAVSIRKAAGGGVLAPEKSENFAGNGVKAECGGKVILAGNKGLLEKHGIVSEAVAQGTVIYVAVDGKYAGAIVIDDEIKPEVPSALSLLRKGGVKTTVMLTGDNDAKAQRVGKELSLDKIYSSLLPADKVDKLAEMCDNKAKGTAVAYVGDGINDAPVLARADVGVAMGGIGSDAAIEAADIVIMDDNIGKLPLAVKIARQTRRIVKENISFALIIKITVIALAAAGISNMWAGVMADVGVAVLCILNSMRTLKQKG